MSATEACGRKFDRRVRKAVYALEAAGCRLRPKDANHLTILPPEGVEGPTKRITASRPAEETLHYIRKQFAEPLGLEGVLP